MREQQRWEAEEAWRKEQARREAAEAARREAEEARRKEQANRERLARLARPLAEVTIPTAVAGSERLAVDRKRENDLIWADLPVDVPPVGRFGPGPDPFAPLQVTGACWARDGSSFYTLTRAGVLRRIGYPDLKVLHKIDALLVRTTTPLLLVEFTRAG
jgi:hypothetical protein